MLVAPVGLELRRTREVEVEVARQPRRAGCAGEDHAKDVGVLVVGRDVTKVQKLGCCARRVPLADVATRAAARAPSASERVTKLALQAIQVVHPRLDAHQQAVERRDVDTDGVVPGLERLNERRARARERVEDAAARTDVPSEERLDELRYELAEIGMEPVDVLRALALGELALRPRQMEPFTGEIAIERGLRHRHEARVRPRQRVPWKS